MTTEETRNCLEMKTKMMKKIYHLLEDIMMKDFLLLKTLLKIPHISQLLLNLLNTQTLFHQPTFRKAQKIWFVLALRNTKIILSLLKKLQRHNLALILYVSNVGDISLYLNKECMNALGINVLSPGVLEQSKYLCFKPKHMVK